MMKKSPRPKARPSAAPKKSIRPTTRSDFEAQSALDQAAKGYKAGGKVSEYGGKEKYKSKAAMKKHEGKESSATERKEKRMAGGGMCRGMGAATKGGKFSKNG